MGAPALFETDPHEPLGLVTLATRRGEHDAHGERLAVEFSSRGDRVTAHLALPSAPGPRPLVLVAGEHGDAASPTAASPGWLDAGAAQLRIDLPLQGERANPKFGDRLRACVDQAAGGETISRNDTILWHEFMRQSVIDLRRALDAMEAFQQVDVRRVAYAGFGMAALLGPLLLSADARPCAAALVDGGGGFGPPTVDPSRFVADVAPRPLLMLNAERGTRISRQAAESLASRAGDAVIHWEASADGGLTAAGSDRLVGFVSTQLGLGSGG